MNYPALSYLQDKLKALMKGIKDFEKSSSLLRVGSGEGVFARLKGPLHVFKLPVVTGVQLPIGESASS